MTTPTMSHFKKLVLGIGNPLRADDGIGIHIAETLLKTSLENTTVLKKQHAGIELIDDWKDTHLLIVVDAAYSGKQVGTTYFGSYPSDTMAWDLFGYSSHSVSLGEALEIAKALGKLPPKVYVCMIEGGNFSLGESLSPEVEEAIPKAVELIKAKLTTEELLFLAQLKKQNSDHFSNHEAS